MDLVAQTSSTTDLSPKPVSAKRFQEFLQCQRCKRFLTCVTSTAKRVHNVKCLSSTISANPNKPISVVSSIVPSYEVCRWPESVVELRRFANSDVLNACEKLQQNAAFLRKSDRRLRLRPCHSSNNKLAEEQILSNANDSDSETDTTIRKSRRRKARKDPSFQTKSNHGKSLKINSEIVPARRRGRPRLLEKDKKKREEEKYATCEFCQRLVTRINLYQHIYRFHNSEFNNLSAATLQLCTSLKVIPHVECEQCGKKISKAYLKDHQRFHLKIAAKAKNSKITCVLCGQGFARTNAVKKHFVGIHMETCPFVCRFPDCNRRAGNYYQLERHVTHHLASTISSCEDCGFSFARFSRLLEHKASGKCSGQRGQGVIRLAKGKSRRRIYSRSRMSNYKLKRVNMHEFVSSTSSPAISTKKAVETSGMPAEDTKQHPIVKTEATAFEIERVHLTDKIIEGENGPIHIKGEQIEPVPENIAIANCNSQTTEIIKSEKEQHFLSTTETDKDIKQELNSDISDVSSSHIKLAVQKQILRWNEKMMSNKYLNTLIREDPTFRRLEQEHPKFTELILRDRGIHSRDYKLSSKAKLIPFPCTNCPATFRRAYALDKHLKLGICRLKNSKSQDSVGAKTPTEIPDLDKDGAVSSTCITCGYQSTSLEDLENHFKTSVLHKRIDKWEHLKGSKCPVKSCGNWFESSRKLQQHIDRVHNVEKTFKCGLCNKSYATHVSLKAHEQRAHSTKRSYGCSKCHRQFVLKDVCEEHEKLCEEKQTRPKCQQCGEDFGGQLSLRRHVLIVHLGHLGRTTVNGSLKSTQNSNCNTETASNIDKVDMTGQGQEKADEEEFLILGI